MSTPDPFSSGNQLLHYRLGDRVGAAVWKAEDTRSGKSVALKVLTKQLPKDQARRDALVREIRLGAALYHAFLVPILEIAVAGDALLMVMEWVDGQTLSKVVGGRPLDRYRFFRVAYQIADALKFLHGKGVVHGNLTGDSILVTANDQVKIGGLNVTNVLTKRETTSSAYQQKGNDLRSVAYMSPEQISGQQVDSRTDLFSFGVIMYEMTTGRLPHQAPNPAELAHKIVSEPPPSPKAINPSLDSAALAIIGKCVFKDAFSRYKETKLLVDDLAKADPEAVKYASQLASRLVTPTGEGRPAATVRKSLLFIADVADYEVMKVKDEEAANRAAARMQQILGEAVYLFDGQVVDPFGPRMVAELPNVDSALEAARKGEFDFSPEQQGSEGIQVRMLLHAGEVTTKDGAVVGEAVTKAAAALAELSPLKLFISEEFVKAAKPNVRLRDAGARAGVKLYSIAPAEPQPKPQPAEEAEPAPPTKAEVKPRKPAIFLIPIAAVVVVAIAVGVMLMMRRTVAPPKTTAVKPAAPVAPPPPRTLVLQPFTVEGADAALAGRANAIRLATLEIFRTVPDLRISDVAAADSLAVTATVRIGTTGPEMVASAGGSAAQPIALADAATGIQSLVDAIKTKMKVTPRTSSVAEALNAFADAVAANAANDPAKTEAAIRAAIKADPSFLPAQLLAMSFFEARRNEKDALEAAKQVVALQPENLDATWKVARASLNAGDLTTALAALNSILKKNKSDLEALNLIARYAVAAGDTQHFNAASTRLKSHPPAQVAAHEPDFLVATGKMGSAVDKYYDIEVQVPNNPSLALKIGRIAVLRHTLPIAELELGKLQQADPNYGYHLLKAYLAAQQGASADAMKELETAKTAARPGDDYWTTAAEVYAMMADTSGALSALEQAAARKEPGLATVPTNPLFEYLGSDPRFEKIKAAILAEQQEIRSALAQVAM